MKLPVSSLGGLVRDGLGRIAGKLRSDLPPSGLGAAVLRAPRAVALALIAFLVTAASLVSFAESYRGLYLWAHHHELSGIWAAMWPVQVDTFVAVGELALLVGLVDRWPVRSRAAAWLVTVLGLAASVAGNIGHVTGSATATGSPTGLCSATPARSTACTRRRGTGSARAARAADRPVLIDSSQDDAPPV